MQIDIENAIMVTMPPAEAEIVIAELNRLRQQNMELGSTLKMAHKYLLNRQFVFARHTIGVMIAILDKSDTANVQ